MQDAGSAGLLTTAGEGKARVLLLVPCPTSARTAECPSVPAHPIKVGMAVEGDLTHSPPGKQQINLACSAATLQTAQKMGEPTREPLCEDRPALNQPSC